MVRLPLTMVMSVILRTTEVSLHGNDVTQDVHFGFDVLEWTLETQGIPLEASEIMLKSINDNDRPQFRVTGILSSRVRKLTFKGRIQKIDGSILNGNALETL